MNISTNFGGQLSRQLDFLRRSCADYDAGHHDEAIRIATGLRILIHQTKNSTSLLKHLSATTINLLCTTEDIPEDTAMHTGMGRMRLRGNGSSEYFPTLGDSFSKRLVPVSKWWSQAVMVIDGKRISRKDIVLGAANQDGGAHVDAALSKEYGPVTLPGAAGSLSFVVKGVKYEKPLRDTHLVSLRQMGHEVLNSPDLLALTKN